MLICICYKTECEIDTFCTRARAHKDLEVICNLCLSGPVSPAWENQKRRTILTNEQNIRKFEPFHEVHWRRSESRWKNVGASIS